MGAFAPSPLVDDALDARIMREIVNPVVSGMAAEGYPFRGFLYVGLMLTPTGPKVIEFNARLGDPEAQVILPLHRPSRCCRCSWRGVAASSSSPPAAALGQTRGRRARFTWISGIVGVGAADRRRRSRRARCQASRCSTRGRRCAMDGW